MEESGATFLINLENDLLKLISLLAIVSLSPSALAQPQTLIHNVTIVSPEQVAPLEKAYLIIDGDRIATVGNGKLPKVKPDSKIIDGQGAYLIPGLIDAHVHLTQLPGMNRVHRKKFPILVEKYRAQLPRSYLYYGYTTLIDLAVVDRDGLNAIKKAPLTPDIYDCDQPVPLANGYPMSYTEPEERFDIYKNFLYDPRQKGKIPATIKASEHTPKAAVERIKKGGGICVKTHFEPGFDGETLPTPTIGMLRELAIETQKANLKLLIHANSLEAQTFSLEAPPDIFVHGMWNWGKLQEEPGLPLPIRKTLDKIAAQNIGYMPTFQVMDGTRALFDPKYLDSPRLKKIISSDLLAWYKTNEGKWFPNLLREQVKLSDKEMVAANEKRISQLGLTVGYLLTKKGRLLFGSDTPASPTYGNLPGLNGYLEMHRWAEAKVPLSVLLRSATLANAEALGLAKDYGTVTEGKVANLLLLSKNPLESVEAYEAIQTVVIRGKVVPREDLAAQSLPQ